MKRILFLLLLTVSVYGQNPSRFAKIQITGNSNSGTATKVNVQEANGEVNTQAINTGFNKNFGLNSGDVVGATTLLNQYSTTPIDWTATAFSSGQVVFYAGKQWIAISNTVSGDVPAVSAKWIDATFEGLFNKPAESVDWTDITNRPSTFPPSPHTHVISDVTTLQTTLDGKANLSGNNNFTGNQTAFSFIKTGGTSSQFLKADGSVDSNSYASLTGTQTFTGVNNFPTATAGTNTTQVATTAFVLANATNIPQLESNGTDLTVWNNGKGNVSTNTSFGESSLKLNSTGSSNTSIGQGALSNNTTGSNNTSIGSNSLLSSNGNNNTSIGVNALVSNTSGTSNTALGMSALSINTTGGQNVAIGFNAGNVTAFNNINNSLFLGYNALPLSNGQTNEIVIGHNATGAGSNTATLGNTNITSTILRGTVSGGSFVKNSAPTTNLLLAGGGDIAQSTFFATPTGLTTNFLPKWNGSGFGNSDVREVSGNIGVGVNPTSSPNNQNITMLRGASIQSRIAAPQLAISSNINGDYYDATYQESGYAAQIALDPANMAGGAAGFKFAVAPNGIAGQPIVWQTAFIINKDKRALFNTTTDNGNDIIQANGTISAIQYKISALNTAPATATSTGTLGEVRITATHIYVCTATNTWVRTALTTW